MQFDLSGLRSTLQSVAEYALEWWALAQVRAMMPTASSRFALPAGASCLAAARLRGKPAPEKDAPGATIRVRHAALVCLPLLLLNIVGIDRSRLAALGGAIPKVGV